MSYSEKEIPEEENILDRFTDPVKKIKKKRKREQEETEKRKNICMSGKEFAKDQFNEPMTTMSYDLVKSYIEKPPDQTFLTQRMTEVDQNDIGHQKSNSKDGLSGVFDFILCAGKCMQWLDIELKKIGWKKNMTNYNPVSVSHSSSEVQEASIECFKMACKQMMRYLEKETIVI
jgi:hypothetical protein